MPAGEMIGEQALAEGDARRLVGFGQTRALPGLFRALDDEGAHRRIEGVGVDLEEAVLALPKDEREGIVDLVRAEPDEARLALFRPWPEGVGVLQPRRAVDAIRRDQEVRIA